MTETLPDSKAQTDNTTQTSGDSIVALPNLSEAKAPISLTLTIDKSVGKVAAWVVGLVVGMAAMVGAGIVLAILMIIEWREAQMEARVKTQELIYLQSAVLAHGIPIPHPPGNEPTKEEKTK